MLTLRPVHAIVRIIALVSLLAACAGPAATASPPLATAPPQHTTTPATAAATATSAPHPTAVPATATTAPATATAAAATATAAAATATAAATAKVSFPPPQKSMSVLEWTGYDDPLYWADFKAANPNVDVNFTFGESDADVYGKMKAGDQSDLFHAYTGWLQFYVDEGLAQEIDTSRLSNWDKVPDSFKAVGQFNGKQYFVPFDWGFTSILYRTDKVPAPIDTWAALFDNQYAGHISMWDDGPSAVTTSAYVHGYDETAITDAQLAAIKAEWIAQAPLNFSYWTSDQTELVPWMTSADVTVAYAWQGAYATLLKNNVPVAYSDPKEGRNSWVGVYGISKNSTNLANDYAFLDGKLGEVTGTNLVNNFYYGSANADVMSSITDEQLKQAFSIDDPTVLQRTNFTPNLTAAQRDAWTAMWADVKASQ
jgi:spermidine/putrescine transport system substrate-binding protein